MNNRYFGCPKCCRYIDAGYRWAYWTLESAGTVKLGQGIDVEKILEFDPYWNPPDDEKSDWLEQTIFPSVKLFLERHRTHGILYIEEDYICAEETLIYNWTEVNGTSPDE